MIRKAGRFYRRSDSRWIQRFHCNSCLKNFSIATFSPCYKQHRRRLNKSIRDLFCAKVTQRRMAIILKCNRKTIARKLKFLSVQASESRRRYFRNKKFDHIQFDDLETIEGTKLLPVTVTVAVSGCRKVLGFKVARIPAKGHLAKKSRKKYGFRKNEAPVMRDLLISEIAPLIEENALIESDEHPAYEELVKKYFPKAEYVRYKSKRSSLSGSGELKKTKYDPLFKINHSFAMFRDNMSRLVRKTWATTKSLEALEQHLSIYADYHNRILTPPLS